MIVVIGGGAAGIFAAISCAQKGHKVVLLEKTAQLLAKVRISGGGRCNVTHACFDPKDLIKNYPRGGIALLGPFTRFGPNQTIEWFAERGVPLKTEEDGRMFPITDSSQTIIDCLLVEAKKVGVEIHLQQKIDTINKFLLEGDTVILATGSSKQGYEWAKSLGHTIVDPVPSLFTFNVPTSPLLDLAGITVPQVEISVPGYKQRGPLLLTHWGFSGPAALKLSAWGARYLHSVNYRTDLTINWLPDTDIYAIIKKQDPAKFLIAENLFGLPKNLWRRFIDRGNMNRRIAELSHKQIREFADLLQKDTYSIDGKTTYKEEFVTAGGIPLDEVNFKTMESKICPRLFFAGEILDIDGVTGGFNFQNAWTTGYLTSAAIS